MTDLPPHLRAIAERSEVEHERALLFYFETDVCTYDPRVLEGWPLGQMHCPVCDSMQLAGETHMGWGRLELEDWLFFHDDEFIESLVRKVWGPEQAFAR